MRDHALEYAEAGFPVTPLWWIEDGKCACKGKHPPRDSGKHPIGELCPNGILDATDDTDTVTTWWTKYPQANIAIATGHTVFVVDCDKKKGVDGTRELLAMARDWGDPQCMRTAAVDTGGGGSHFYFSMEDHIHVPNRQGLLVAGKELPIDVRGHHGYVVAPPSTHITGQRYDWVRDLACLRPAPPQLLSLVTGPAPETSRDGTAKRGPGRVRPHEVANIQTALKLIDPDCGYEDWALNVGAALHDYFGGKPEGLEIWDTWSRQGAKYPGAKELRKKWRSFRSLELPNPRSIASFWKLATDKGWKPTLAAVPQVVRKSQEDQAAILKSVLGQDVVNPGEFPARKIIDRLTGPMRDTANWILQCARRADPTLALAATITLVSGCLSRRVRGPDDTGAGLVLATLAPSGAGKDIPQACVAHVIHATKDLGVGVMAETPFHKAQLDEVVLEYHGQTSLQIDEYGHALKQWTANQSSMSHAIRSLTSQRTSVYKLYPLSPKHPLRTRFPEWKRGLWSPVLTVSGWCTPTAFYEGLTTESITDGFLGRHLVLHTKSHFPLKSPTMGLNDVPQRLIAWLSHLVETPIPEHTPPSLLSRANADRTEPVRLGWENDTAREYWDYLVNQLDQRAMTLDGDNQEVSMAVLRRLPGVALPLALVLACGRSSNPLTATICRNDVDTAVQIATWSANHLAYQLRFGTAKDDWEKVYTKVWKRLESQNGDKVYRASFRSARDRRHLPQVWQTLADDPRLEVTPVYARLNPEART
jgi:putative DNA primase/helicase